VATRPAFSVQFHKSKVVHRRFAQLGLHLPKGVQTNGRPELTLRLILAAALWALLCTTRAVIWARFQPIDSVELWTIARRCFSCNFGRPNNVQSQTEQYRREKNRSRLEEWQRPAQWLRPEFTIGAGRLSRQDNRRPSAAPPEGPQSSRPSSAFQCFPMLFHLLQWQQMESSRRQWSAPKRPSASLLAAPARSRPDKLARSSRLLVSAGIVRPSQ